MSKYARTLAELKEKAVLFWPREILEREASVSILPLLLKTQEKFISILNLSDSSPDSWKKLVDVSDDIKGNLFLKHLMVLSDLGGEVISHLPPLKDYFKDSRMKYIWRKEYYEYQFKVVQNYVSLTNTALRINEKQLLKGHLLEPKMEDIIMLLLHGGSSLDDTLPSEVKKRCIVGSFIGDSYLMGKFIKPFRIVVSGRP